jgi:membrane protein
LLYLNKEKVIKFTLLLSIITLCGAIMAVILYGVNQFKMGSQLASINQVSYLSHTLVRQQANLMSVLLLNNADQETLSENLDRFLPTGIRFGCHGLFPQRCDSGAE